MYLNFENHRLVILAVMKARPKPCLQICIREEKRKTALNERT